MKPDRSRRATVSRGRILLATALAIVLSLTALARAIAPSSTSTASEARSLRSAIAGSARLARVRLAPGASALARGLPGTARRLGSLRGPAATTEEQLSVALGQLQQMNVLTYDPHYLPALLAVGRAYLASSGSDPLTGTAVDPEYAGLGSELAAGRAQVQRSSARAASLSRDIRTLTADLAREKRRASRLTAALDRIRRGGAGR